jgi:hypothetical protein
MATVDYFALSPDRRCRRRSLARAASAAERRQRFLSAPRAHPIPQSATWVVPRIFGHLSVRPSAGGRVVVEKSALSWAGQQLAQRRGAARREAVSTA